MPITEINGVRYTVGVGGIIIHADDDLSADRLRAIRDGEAEPTADDWRAMIAEARRRQPPQTFAAVETRIPAPGEALDAASGIAGILLACREAEVGGV